mmetsp:Transcript_272/g.462  ORF Transcript_272/g.462 Transcript_272/m.462 type:complete len:118 (-) Transcript_272:3-356(-)
MTISLMSLTIRGTLLGFHKVRGRIEPFAGGLPPRNRRPRSVVPVVPLRRPPPPVQWPAGVRRRPLVRKMSGYRGQGPLRTAAAAARPVPCFLCGRTAPRLRVFLVLMGGGTDVMQSE